MWAPVSNYVSESDGRVYVGATAQLDEAQLGQVQARLRPETSVVNKRAFVARMVSLIQRDLGLMGGLSLALVVGLVGLTFRRLRETLVALAPVLGALLWTLGLMGALGIPFNIVNTLVAVFVAGDGNAPYQTIYSVLTDLQTKANVPRAGLMSNPTEAPAK